MIHFPILRTRRLSAQLKELSIGQSIAIAQIPETHGEAMTTAFLNAALVFAEGIPDPRRWTVEERMMAVCHYIAVTSDAGADFPLGQGKYSDYLDIRPDAASPDALLELGEIAGDVWQLCALTGEMAEAVERLEGELPGFSGRLHWLVGGMAAQLCRAGDGAPPEGGIDAGLLEKMRVLTEYPESVFLQLLQLYRDGREKTAHLFNTDFSSKGIVALPKGGRDDLPPARFSAISCVSSFAQSLAG